MNSVRYKNRFFSLRTGLLSLGALAILVLALILFTGQVSGSVQRESERIAHDAIVRALISCYAAEGSYPSSLAYLEKRYGVTIDYGNYVVDYVVFASNVMPEVTLTKRNNDKERRRR